MKQIKIVIYSTANGKEPYSTWENKLDKSVKTIVKNRLDRMLFGNFGDSKPIKASNGVWELKIDNGPGYRIYFGKKENYIILLLLGGDKKSQLRDIEKAKQYWLDIKDAI